MPRGYGWLMAVWAMPHFGPPFTMESQLLSADDLRGVTAGLAFFSHYGDFANAIEADTEPDRARYHCGAPCEGGTSGSFQTLQVTAGIAALRNHHFAFQLHRH
jgi:hypothetical protein